jgi:imidazole glycerol phosphate synthase glutamine amidotransferase subunit
MTVLIDYGMGNLDSIANMLKKNGKLGHISLDPDLINNEERLISPGVGAFDNGMRRLEELDLVDVIKNKVKDGSPLLGICLGMQLLTNRSEEGELPGLGLIDADTIKFNDEQKLNISHMGWNSAAFLEA